MNKSAKAFEVRVVPLQMSMLFRLARHTAQPDIHTVSCGVEFDFYLHITSSRIMFLTPKKGNSALFDKSILSVKVRPRLGDSVLFNALFKMSEGKLVLVTGAAGLIASHCIKQVSAAALYHDK